MQSPIKVSHEKLPDTHSPGFDTDSHAPNKVPHYHLLQTQAVANNLLQLGASHLTPLLRLYVVSHRTSASWTSGESLSTHTHTPQMEHSSSKRKQSINCYGSVRAGHVHAFFVSTRDIRRQLFWIREGEPEDQKIEYTSTPIPGKYRQRALWWESYSHHLRQYWDSYTLMLFRR